MMIVSNIPTKLEIMYKMHNILYDKKKKKKQRSEMDQKSFSRSITKTL